MTERVAIRRTAAWAVAAGLVGAFVAGAWVAAQTAPSPKAPAAYKAEAPANCGLDANLFTQTAAEYRAGCYQAYNLAALRLRDAVAKNPAGKLAVVMDLDEAVLDNAGFQAMQLRSNLAYDQRLWDAWERDHGDLVGLVPGAKEFILEAGRRGVAVAYVSNRDEKFRDQTKKLPARLGIPAASDALLKLSTDTRDKTACRNAVEFFRVGRVEPVPPGPLGKVSELRG